MIVAILAGLALLGALVVPTICAATSHAGGVLIVGAVVLRRAPASPSSGRSWRMHASAWLRAGWARFGPRLSRDIAAQVAGIFAATTPASASRAGVAHVAVLGVCVTIPPAPPSWLLPKLCALLGLALAALALLARKPPRTREPYSHPLMRRKEAPTRSDERADDGDTRSASASVHAAGTGGAHA